MRRLVAVLLTAIILLPIQASAASDDLWDEARVFDQKGTSGGTIGGLSIPLNNNTTHEGTTVSSGVNSLPTVVEVYTSTWCLNCVKTEQALDEAIENTPATQEVTRIHYHRHLYETLDPFGSNSTDHHWINTYGQGSLLSSGTSSLPGIERSAPSIVFDGERMYTGTSTKSNSLQTDYATGLSMGSSHPFHPSASLSLSVSKRVYEDFEASNYSYSWQISESCYPEEIETFEVFHFGWDVGNLVFRNVNADYSGFIARLMLVEDSAYFPEGSNGKGNYSHVLHSTWPVDAGGAVLWNGRFTPTATNNNPVWEFPVSFCPAPGTWDGDDMSVVLMVDWTTRIPSDGNSMPAPALSTLLCMLAALVPRRERDSKPMQ